MRLNKKVMLSIVALPLCAALVGCAATTEQSGLVAKMEQSEWVVVQPATRPAPIVKAPIYKNGDWWKVKIERKGSTPGWKCQFDYSDYLLEIQEGKPKLYGIDGTNKEEFDCPLMEDEILGKITGKLKFPLRVGKRWAHLYNMEIGTGYHGVHRWVTIDYEVLGWERVQTPKGEFEAFKLSSYVTTLTYTGYKERRETYYYSPKVKAIILRKFTMLRLGQHERDATNTVVDFNVRN